ncbi:hypothetical protein M8623_003364 [Salmonella enterica subsp. enterica]|nr:hypothetical protein [Salmonella enterica subsp. enterica]
MNIFKFIISLFRRKPVVPVEILALHLRAEMSKAINADEATKFFETYPMGIITGHSSLMYKATFHREVHTPAGHFWAENPITAQLMAISQITMLIHNYVKIHFDTVEITTLQPYTPDGTHQLVVTICQINDDCKVPVFNFHLVGENGKTHEDMIRSAEIHSQIARMRMGQ